VFVFKHVLCFLFDLKVTVGIGGRRPSTVAQSGTLDAAAATAALGTTEELAAAASAAADSRWFSVLGSKGNQSHTLTHDKNNTTNDHTKDHPPHSTTMERLTRR